MMPVIADLALTITPATALYKSPVLDANISVSETTNEGRNAIVLDLFQGDGVYARDLGTIFQWPTGGINTAIVALNVPATTKPWNDLDPFWGYYATSGSAPISIPVTPGQRITFSYVSGTISLGGVRPSVSGNGEGAGTTGGVHPWPSDRLPGGFTTGSAGELVGAYIDAFGSVITAFRIDNTGTTPIAPASTVALTVGVNAEGAFGTSTGSWNYVYAFGTTIPVALARTVLYIWQPSIIPQPESIYDRATDWNDGGMPGDKFIQGVTVEANSFNNAKTFFLQDSDTLTLHALNECPATFNKQSTKSFSCVTPFIAHSTRLISSDGVAWQVFAERPVFQPFPSSCMNWQTETTSLGLIGWGHVREMNIPHISSANLTLVLTFDFWPPITIIIPSSAGVQAKTKVTLPPNKFKLLSLRISSASPFRLFADDLELKIKKWGSTEEYQILRPFGGPSRTGASV